MGQSMDLGPHSICLSCGCGSESLTGTAFKNAELLPSAFLRMGLQVYLRALR